MTSSSSSKKSRAVALRNYFSPFGNKLVAGGHVEPDQLRQALVQVKKTGRSLPEEIKLLTGRELSPELLRQYKKNQLFELKVLYGVDSLDPEVAPVATQEMADLIGKFFPLDTCRRFQFLPLAQQDSEPPSVLVAMVDPDNLAAQDELNRILRVKGFELRRLVITHEDFNQLLDQYYSIREEWEALQDKKDEERALNKLNDLTDIVGSLDATFQENKEDMDNALDSEDANQAPVINLVNKILAKALQEGTSDIHIEPQEETLRVRFRKDGVLNQAFRPPTPEDYPGGGGPFQNYGGYGYCRKAFSPGRQNSPHLPG